MSTNIDKVTQCWGDVAPEWVLALAQACDLTSQSKVARQLERSSSLVNQVLQNKYSGDLNAIQERIEGVFMSSEIGCPALGQIPAHECQNWRQKAKKYVNTNALRVRMHKACTSCPRFTA